MIEEGEESTEEDIDDVKGANVVNDLEQEEADTGGAATVFALGFSQSGSQPRVGAGELDWVSKNLLCYFCL